MNDSIPPITVNYAAAASITGYSIDMIKKAINAGDLPVVAGSVNGRPIDKPVIPYEALRAWANQAAPVRKPRERAA